jgi:hypothetical protein
MTEKDAFGENLSKNFIVGDLVEWTSWDSKEEEWARYYGILLTIKNEIRSNRLVSISKVTPLHLPNTELEFFTMSLRLVSRGEETPTVDL